MFAKPYLLFLFLFFFNVFTYAATVPHNYYFKQISTKEGLSHSRVQCVCTDYNGDMWIGTKSGLNKYNRSGIQKFVHIDNDPYSLPNNNIYFIVEDQNKTLWIATDGGIVTYNRKQNNFTPVLYNNQILYIYSYIIQNDGILFGGVNVFYKYKYNEKEIEIITPKNTLQIKEAFQNIFFISPTEILANTKIDGIYKYNIEKNEIHKIPEMQDLYYPIVFIDSYKQIWVSSYQKGIYCYSTNGKLKRHFFTGNSKLKNNVILDIKEKDKQLWLATDGGGINILSLDDYTFDFITNDQDDLNSFPTNSIYCLFPDNNNNMWAGCIRDGLIGIKNVDVKFFKNVPRNNRYGLSNKNVQSLFEDEDSIIWIGTDGGGLNKYNPKTMQFKHYDSSLIDMVTSIAKIDNDKLLLSVYNKGLYIFRKSTAQTERLILVDNETDKKACTSSYSINISSINEDNILICTDKIYTYNIKKQQFTLVSARKNSSYYSPIMISTDSLYTYLLSRVEIYQWNHKDNSFRTIYTIPLPDNFLDGYMDNQGMMWLGCRSGLIKFDPITKKSQKVTTYLFDEVSLIIGDNQNRLWLGSRDMLLCNSLKTGNISVLGESDGVFANEYIPHATLLSKNGDIFIGGSSGLLHIKKDISLIENGRDSLKITAINLNGIPFDIPDSKKINIPWNFNSLDINVTPQNNDLFKIYSYKFKIEGLNDQIKQTFNSKISFYSLPSGDYKLMASIDSGENGQANLKEILSIHVKYPWWQTGQFILILIISILLIVFYIVSYIIKKKKKQQERELTEIKSKSYEEKIGLLINLNHEMRTPLTLIYAPLKRILSNDGIDSRLKDVLNNILRQVEKMNRFVNMVLDIQKMEVNQKPVNITYNDINKWALSIRDDFNNEFAYKNIELRLEQDNIEEQIPFDKNKCEIVLSNLLINSLKFSEEQSTVTILVKKNDNMIKISVSDQGIGLKTEDIPYLFNRFYQVDKNNYGNGIGLSYSKVLIEMQGGSMGAYNNTDKGATFYFQLPLKKKNKLIHNDPIVNLYKNFSVTNDITQNIDLQKYSVLIVEDEAELRSYVKDKLTDSFKHVYSAKDGEEGLSIVKQYLPDIVISDIMMPNLNGFELCKAIKEDINISHIPVILLTALIDNENRFVGHKMGADDYLAKPFEIDVLIQIIQNRIKNKELIKAYYNENPSSVGISENAFGNADESFMIKLNNYINENFNNCDLKVDDIAKGIGVSRALLFNKVKALTNLGVVDYITKIRITKAEYLLTNSNKSITEISEEVGFSSQHYFSKVFKDAKGFTPSKYRGNL